MKFVFILSFLSLFSSIFGQDDRNYLKTRPNSVEFDNKSRFRLPSDVVPTYYLVELYPAVDNGYEYSGNVQISINVLNEVDTFYLNAENIEIIDASLNELPTFRNVLDACNQIIQFQLIECTVNKMLIDTLTPGRQYSLYLNFKGKYGTDNRGLYKSTYKGGANDEIKQILTTHFGQQARRLFPCFDEPKFKAKFELWIHRNAHQHTMEVISNSNIAKSLESVNTIDMMKVTSLLSPYILGVVVSDFSFRGDESRGNHKFGVFARPNAYEQTLFSFEIGPKLMDAFGEWTLLDWYDFEDVEKMDMVAIPDFSAGGEFGSYQKNIQYICKVKAINDLWRLIMN